MKLISFVKGNTASYGILAGDTITGAAEGVGALRQPAVFLAPGDRIEVEVSGIGTLVNGVREQVL